MRITLQASAAVLIAASVLLPLASKQAANAVTHHRKHHQAHGNSIMDKARASSNLSTFTKAVAAAGLTSTLEHGGPYTVFAPDNAAFGKVPKQKLDDLMKDKKQLREVLLYHVVKGHKSAADLQHPQALDTVEGEKLMTNLKDDKVEVGGALVKEADKKASNGTIHVIDDVLTPPASRF